MEKILFLNWRIHNNEIQCEERYCHNCGKKVVFKDSLKRRQNANGKSIFHYAIYKCPNGHTSNKILDSFKTTSGLQNKHQILSEEESKLDDIAICDIINGGVTHVQIIINSINVKLRIDKLLANQIIDISRTKIEAAINNGYILVNENVVKTRYLLNEKDIVLLSIKDIKQITNE